MDFIDRAKTTTTSTGTGAIVCSATPASVEYQSLSSLGVGKTFPYAISAAGSPEWEVGVGTITAANTFTRLPTASSNGGSLVSFSAGTKDVVCTVTADYLKGSTVLDLPVVTTATTSDYILVTKADGSGSYRVLVSAFASSGGTTPSDTTAPTLSAISASSTGATTATGSVTTNEANGTLYWLYSTSATATATQVKAGNNKAITATGAQVLAATGLTASTTYYLHALHRDAAGNDSAVLDSASFTTSAAPTTPVYQVRTTDAGGNKINGINYFPPAGSQGTMARSANGVDYFTNNNDIYVSVLKADGTTMAPSPIKVVWLKSSTTCPVTFSDTQLPNGANGNVEPYGDAFRGVNIIYGNTFNVGNVNVRGTPGVYYLWVLTSDGFVGVYDNATGTPIGWTLVAG